MLMCLDGYIIRVTVEGTKFCCIAACRFQCSIGDAETYALSASGQRTDRLLPAMPLATPIDVTRQYRGECSCTAPGHNTRQGAP